MIDINNYIVLNAEKPVGKGVKHEYTLSVSYDGESHEDESRTFGSLEQAFNYFAKFGWVYIDRLNSGQ